MSGNLRCGRASVGMNRAMQKNKMLNAVINLVVAISFHLE